MSPVSPADAMRLLREGRTVAQVVRWTRCSRGPLVAQAQLAGLLIDPETDRAFPATQASRIPIRDWARKNGWPHTADRGRLPRGLAAAYAEAHQ